MIEKELFLHPYETVAYDDMKLAIPFEEQLSYQYLNYTQEANIPDLLGKTVKVGSRQFNCMYDVVKKIACLLQMPTPDVYVYENFYYTVESKGLNDCWIEISAKTLSELKKGEIIFLLTKEMCAIKLRHTYYYTIISEALNAIRNNVSFTGIGTIQSIAKAKMYRWARLSSYTSDNFAYLVCANLESCMNAVIKTVLNDVFLAENVNIAEYICQGEKISALNNNIHKFTKADELTPYAPFRLKNLIAYAASERGLDGLNILNCKGVM